MLSKLVLCDYLPSSLPNLDSIVVFNISLHTPSDIVKSKLPGVLKRMASLCDLRINLAHLDPNTTLPLLDETSLHSVRKLNICYDASCTRDPVYPYLCNFFNLNFPNADNMHIQVSGTTSSSSNEPIDVRKLLRDLFDKPRFPSVKKCRVEVRLERIHWLDGLVGHFQTTIPIDFPLGIEHLSFECNTSLSLNGHIGRKHIKEATLPSLRTVTLDVAQHFHGNSIATDSWMDWVVGSCRRDNDWGDFQELRILQRDADGNRTGSETGQCFTPSDLDTWIQYVSDSRDCVGSL